MRKRKWKRSLAFILAFVLCLGMLPAPALAADGDMELLVPAEDVSEPVEEPEEAAVPQEPLATNAGDWKMQSFGGNTDLEIPEGAVTPAEDGIGFSADYSKIYGSESAPSGNVVIYYDGQEKFSDSVLEFTLNMQGEEEGRFRFAVFPHFKNGQNCDGIAIDTPAALQHSYRINNSEAWPGLGNLLNKTFETGVDYKLRVVTAEGKMTMYLDEGDGYRKLTETGTAGDLGETTFGFRVWGPESCKDLKKLEVKDVSFRAYVASTVDSTGTALEEDQWGLSDVEIPVTIGEGDAVAAVSCGGQALTPETDYTVGADSVTIKKEYIAAKDGSIALTIEFAGGAVGSFTITKKQGPFVYTEDFAEGADNWVQQSGDGTALLEDGALHITGETLIVDMASPIAANGEAEFVIETLNDNGNFGLVFRAGEDGAWQSFYNNESSRYQYDTGLWNFRDSNGANSQILEDGTPVLKRPDGVNYTMKVRFVGQTLTVWMDGNPIYSADLNQMGQTTGHIGIQTGGGADILLKQVTYRSYEGLDAAESTDTKTIANGSLTVTMAEDFPTVVGYELGGKTMDGCVLPKHYVSVNGTDYPASAVVSSESDSSITYAVTAHLDEEKTVSFNVTFTVQENNILDMQITDIDETDCTVYTLNFPEQPLLSAKKSDSGAAFDASTRSGDKNLNLSGGNAASKTATSYATIAIVTANGLSASLANNVYNNRMEFSYRSFDLGGGDVTTGVWNTDFYYRGIDGKLMLPEGENPSCQIVLTEDTNGDDVLNWQDGANALKTLVGDRIPGAETIRSSDIHVGYNFVSEAQQPFLKIADNYKRFGNLIDGFDQILVFKGYANEGHDSGHADYADISKRGGGAEDLNTMADAIADAGLGIFGIHINHSEAYPEAEMFNDVTMSTKNGWKWMDQSKYIRREVDIMDEEGGMAARLDDMFEKAPGIKFVYVDTYRDDRFAAARLAQSLTGEHGVILGTEDASKLDRWVGWTHGGSNSSTIHRFVYHTQKDVYGSSGNFWGGYNRATSMMSWQHNWNITPLVEAFYTNQLPQKYLMHHEVLRLDGGDAYFEGNIRTNNYQMWKDDKLMVGNGGYFIPWYDEDSTTKNPDDADKIYYWNNNSGEATWDLPNEEWAGLSTVYLYQTTQTGRVLVDTLEVKDGQVTINAQAKTPYVLYPGEAASEPTEWSTGSPIKDTGFNSRNFSIWQVSSTSESTDHIKITDDSNGVAILTMEGTADGQVQQTMTGLVPGQKYRVVVWAGAENGKTARITVETPDGVTHTNYVDQIVRANNCFDTYANGKRVERVWVDFVQPEGETTAVLTLSADACESADGLATFMETRIVKTAEPDLPKGYAANETFEYVEQGGTGIFTPEGGGDGGYHLSHYTEYTDDAIPVNGEWSLKMYGYGSAKMRTYPATMRLMPNTEYNMEFDALGSGTVYIMSESDESDKPMQERFSEGHNKFTFTTGDKTDYIARIEGSNVVLDNFQVFYYEDETPPTVPQNLSAVVEDNARVVLTWDAATDPDTPVTGYKIYRDGQLLATVGAVLTYTDENVKEYTGYSYQVSAVNAGTTEGEQSEAVTAYVGTDLSAPVVTDARLNGLTEAVLVFNETLEKTSAEAVEHYILSETEAVVTAAVLGEDGVTVTLTLDGLAATDTAVLHVVGVKDGSAAGNATTGSQSVYLSAMTRYLKLDEESGETAYDFTGHENGVRSEKVGVTAGVNGNAAKFNGDSCIDLSGATLAGQENYTISLWMNWNGDTSESNTIFSTNTSGDGSSGGVWLRINGGGVITVDNIKGGGVASSKNAKVNEWNHVALVRKPNRTELYLNGEKVVDTDRIIVPDDNILRIGGNFNGSGSLLHKFRGSMDEFKVYTAALTEEEILAIAQTDSYAPDVIGDSFYVALPQPEALEVKVDFNGAALTEIREGETALEASDYTLSGTAVTFSADYLKTLAEGAHVLTLTFEDKTEQTITLNAVPVQQTVDRTELMQAIFEAGLLREEDYTANSWALFQTELAKAVEVSKQETLTAEEIKAAADALRSAMETLISENEDSQVPSYLIKATAGEGGIISPAGSVWVTMGVNKTFAITAKEGYVIADVLVDGVSVGAVSEYTFEKVSTKHTIEAVFKSAEGGETEEGFTDVPSDAWYAEAVKYVMEQGLMNGTSETTFSPMLSMSRSMLVTVLYRLEGEPEAGECPFTDVADGTWYTDAVAWAAANGIVTGTTETTFAPEAEITRESLAVILYRYAEMKEQAQGEKGDLTAFADGASVSDWAVDAMAWAVGEGILTGKSGNTLDPQGTATRAEVATILMRFCSMTEK